MPQLVKEEGTGAPLVSILLLPSLEEEVTDKNLWNSLAEGGCPGMGGGGGCPLRSSSHSMKAREVSPCRAHVLSQISGLLC